MDTLELDFEFEELSIPLLDETYNHGIMLYGSAHLVGDEDSFEVATVTLDGVTIQQRSLPSFNGILFDKIQRVIMNKKGHIGKLAEQAWSDHVQQTREYMALDYQAAE